MLLHLALLLLVHHLLLLELGHKFVAHCVTSQSLKIKLRWNLGMSKTTYMLFLISFSRETKMTRIIILTRIFLSKFSFIRNKSRIIQIIINYG